MAQKNPGHHALNALLQKEMTRKQFLKTLLGAAISIMGFSTIVGIFTKNESTSDGGNTAYGKRGFGP